MKISSSPIYSAVYFYVLTQPETSNIHYRSTSTHVLPDWMKQFFILKIAPLIGVTRPNPVAISLPADYRNRRRKEVYGKYEFFHAELIGL